MLNEATDGRRQRGLEIAATQVIGRNNGGDFMVPSQSVPGKYRVVRQPEGFSCACPDYELTGRTCKHGYAVEFFLRRETKPDGTVIETRAARVTYSQPWSAYNKAQTTEKDQFCALLKELVSSVPSDEHDGDAPMLPALVTATASQFNVERVSADKAYASRLNFGVIESVGAQPLVPFKTTHRGDTESPLWNRLFHYFSFQQDEFLVRYHRRSNIESTFSAMKRKFGDGIRSKSPVAQRNEALLKVLCHNIVCLIHEITESGAAPMFPALEPVRTKNLVAAQQIALLED